MEGLVTVKRLNASIKRETGLILSRSALTDILKKEMGLKWKRARPQARYVNSGNNVKLRRTFALKMLEVCKQRKVIVNFDETCIRGTTGRAYTWAYKGTNPSRYHFKEVKDLALLAAISTEGDIFFQFLTGSNNSQSVMGFIGELVVHLDKHRPCWRKDHVVLLDNCPSHKTKEVLGLLEHL